MGDCVDCKFKDQEIKRLEGELAGKDKTATGLGHQVEELNKRLAEETKRQGEIPDLAAVIAHCESGQCQPHAQQWQALKSGIVKAAYEEIPKRLVEEKAEALGLIPKRIIISGFPGS